MSATRSTSTTAASTSRPARRLRLAEVLLPAAALLAGCVDAEDDCGPADMACLDELTTATEQGLGATRQPFDRIVIFGDSLSDVGLMFESSLGLVPPSQSYWQGRFSDGFTWVDYLAQSYGITAHHPTFFVNKAIGGATAYPYSAEAKALMLQNVFLVQQNFLRLQGYLMGSLAGELDEFESETAFSSRDLVFVWIGANDMYWVAEQVNPDLTPDAIAARASGEIDKALQRIIDGGARNIVLFGNADLNLTPAFKAEPKDPRRSQQAVAFNAKLRELVGRYSSLATIRFVDVDNMFRTTVIPNAGAFGITNTKDAVYDGPSFNLNPLTPTMDFAANRGGDSTNVFWDLAHPTTKIHSLLAEHIRREVIEPTFINQRSLPRCSYVEVENQGAYVLQATAANDSCGPRSVSLSNGKRALMSAPAGSKLQLKAVLGRSTTITVPTQTAIYNPKYASAPLRIQMPVFQRIKCTGTTIIGFDCSSK